MVHASRPALMKKIEKQQVQQGMHHSQAVTCAGLGCYLQLLA
jgi:hypothetical protein